MKRYKKYKILAILLTSFFIVSYELVRHYTLIHFLPRDVDVVVSSILFIVISIIISQVIFNTLEKLERKSYQKEIEAKIMFENSVDAIFVLNSDGEVLEMNGGAELLSGWKQKDGLTFEILFDETLHSLRFYRDKNDNDSSPIIEKSLQTKDNGPTPVSLTFSFMNDLFTNQEKIAIIVRDLSERKQMENVIKKLYTEATQKHYETEILYQISHKMTSIRDLSALDTQKTFRDVTNKIQRLLEGDHVALYLKRSHNDGFSCIASTPNFRNQDYDFSEHSRLASYEFKDNKLVVPIQTEGHTLGFILVEGTEQMQSSMQKQDLIKSIKQIFSITLENSHLYNKLRGVTIVEERERLAREMHDGLAQEISSISMKIQVVKSLIYRKGSDGLDSDRLKEFVRDLETLTNEAYHEIRHHLFNLRTPFQMQKPFLDSLMNYADIFEEHTEIEVEVKVREDFTFREANLSSEMKVHVIRIIQEALSNSKKHSSASSVIVELEPASVGFWRIRIEDNGNGFDYEMNKDQKEHYGLEIMKERAHLFGGYVEINSSRGEGTQIALYIPEGGEHLENH
ncbi:PAS domain-containing sensor histidine kinase [Halobacillus locisalis]|uniref:histidine kinase n=1 Tax=Halobacillus locisalis TaxID=220753 RepID=A0A838CUS9_9BACI|nr:PAS domain-containing sensor histidine kinase [Halobacillus locisalis]MBA2175663.1 PAS domain-containing sensor histidine kinase [Halobacillus locisalis]